MILSAITNYVFKGLKALLLSDYDMKSVLNGSTKESFGTVIIDCIIFVLFSLVFVFYAGIFTASKVSTFAIIDYITMVLFSLVIIFFVRRFIIIKASAIPASSSTFSITF